MTGQPIASEPEAVSTDIHHEDEILDEDYAITVPFARPACRCTEEIREKEPLGCKGCKPVRAISDLESEAMKQAVKQAIGQTKARWAWFSGARALDDELSRRLGTLGYLPIEVRDKIFRLVLDEYTEEAVRYRILDAPLIEPDLKPLGEADFKPLGEADFKPLSEADVKPRVLRPPAPSWIAMKRQFEGVEGGFGIWTQGNHPTYECEKDPKLYQIFCLREKPLGPPPDFVMPLRLATPDTKFEFDRIFLSTMTFDFPCPKALQLFLSELSAVQLSQVGSITIRIYGCDDCSGAYSERIYYKWGFVCAKLPSTLHSINFDLCGTRGVGFNTARGFSLGLEDHGVAKQGLRFLRRQVERIALETEVNLLKTLDPCYNIPFTYLGMCPSTVLDSLDAMVRETEDLIANATAQKERASEDMDIVRNLRIPSYAGLAAWAKYRA